LSKEKAYYFPVANEGKVVLRVFNDYLSVELHCGETSRSARLVLEHFQQNVAGIGVKP
jgi:hypothetical protein